MRASRTATVPALTGIRGIAALLVATYHYFRPLLRPGSVTMRLLGRGYLYVDLFFILSGYVMALTYGATFAGQYRFASVVRFWWKRFARIYPIYGVVLVTMLIAYALVHGDFVVHRGWWVGIGLPHPWRDIPLNLALMQSWGFATGVVGQAWSVSVECAAYIAFPFLVPLLLGRGRAGFLVALLIAATLPGLAVLAAQGDGLYHAGTLDLWDGPPALLRGFGGFVLGMGLRRIALMPRARLAFTDTFGIALLAAYIALLLGNAPDLWLYPIFPLLILCLAGNTGWVGAAFGCRPVFALGLLSYSLYLLHVYLISPMYAAEHALARPFGTTLAWAIAGPAAAVAILALSSFAYLCIEKPGRILLRHLGTTRLRADAPAQLVLDMRADDLIEAGFRPEA